MAERKIALSEYSIRKIVSNSRQYNMISNYWLKNQLKQVIAFWYEDKKRYLVMGIFEDFHTDDTVYLEIMDTQMTYFCTCGGCNRASACAHIGIVMRHLLNVRNEFSDFYILDESRISNDIEAWNERFPEAYQLRGLVEIAKLQQKKRWLGYHTRRTDDLLSETKTKMLPKVPVKVTSGQIGLQLNATLLSSHSYRSDEVLYLVDLKVGNVRPYVVKNVIEFLRRIEQNEYFEYGKQLAFEHSIDNFNDDAQKIISMMMKITERQLKTTYDNRSFCIEKDHLDLFYDTLNSLEDKLKCNLSLETKQLEVELDVETMEVDDVIYYSVQSKENDLISTKNYQYCISKTSIVRYTAKNSIQMMNVQKLFEESYIFNPLQMKKMTEMVLAPVLDHIKINGLDVTPFLPVKESFKLYADLNDLGQLVICTVCSNGVDEHYLFDDSVKNKTFEQEKIEYVLKSISNEINEETHEAVIYESRVFEFVQDLLPQLNAYGKVYISDRLKRFTNIKTVTLQAGVRIEAGLLHVSFSTDGLAKDEIEHLMNAYRRKKRFYLLKDGSTVDLANSEGLEEFDLMDRQLHLQDTLSYGGEYIMDPSMALRFESMEHQFDHIKLERDETFKDLIFKFKQHYSEPMDEKYDQLLRDYQKAGYYWLKKLEHLNFNGILADDMGLGKTIQVIALLDSSRNQDRHSLVVCPSSLLYNWKNEVEKFTDTLTCQVISGSAAQRKLCIEQMENYDLNVITYDALKRDIDLFENKEFYYVILDEAQYIKNQRTKNASSVKALKSNHRLALTGTPIENSLAELWSIFDFLMPKFLFNYHYFSNTYEKPIVNKKDEEISKELKKLVEPFILRRTKKEVLKELPEKIETLYTIDFSEKEWNLYVANLAKVNKDLQKQLKLDTIDRFQILAMLTRLRQICCDPNIVFEDYPEQGSKMTACLELVETLASSGKKMLLFSSFTSVLDALKEKLDERGISSYTLQGSTSKEERIRLVERFQMDDTPVFLISLKAGGTGLNLTAAEAVIHYDPWWNLSAQNQATDRAHRIGQTNMVSVYSLIMKDSIEEKIMKLQQEKKNLADVFVEDSHGSIAKMSQDEILDLFEIPNR